MRGGPIRTQASDVAEMLADPARCQVVLVTLPETTPVNELIETAYALEERVGVQLGPVVVNGVDAGPSSMPTPTATPAAAARPRPSSATPGGRCTTRDRTRLAEMLAIEQIHLPTWSPAGTRPPTTSTPAGRATLASSSRRGERRSTTSSRPPR